MTIIPGLHFVARWLPESDYPLTDQEFEARFRFSLSR